MGFVTHVSAACRASGTTKQVVTTTRGPGQFIGEVSLFEGHSGDAQWKTCVRARGSLKALLLTRGHLRTLLQRAPEAEAAVRAGARAPLINPLMLDRTTPSHTACLEGRCGN